MVTDWDRICAAEICSKPDIKAAILAGEADDFQGIKLIAAHREAAERAGAQAGLEAAAKALEGGSFLHDEAPAARLAREAARAIRAIDPASLCRQTDQESAT